MAQCQNNLKQLALGFLQHEERQGKLPSGGWGCQMLGDPNRGFGKRQPGSWCFSILPFIEQLALFNLGYGAAEGSAAQIAANDQRIQTPVPIMYCPTRRPALAYPVSFDSDPPWTYCDPIASVARCDYAACCGDPPVPLTAWNPPSFTPYSSVDQPNPRTTPPNFYWAGLARPRRRRHRAHLRQRPCPRLQHGLLRRGHPNHELFDRPGDASPAGHPRGKASRGCEKVLTGGLKSRRILSCAANGPSGLLRSSNYWW